MSVTDLLRRAAATEGAMWRSLWRLARRRHRRLAPGEEAFGYVGVARPLLGVFIALSVIELPILDLIVRHVVPWRPARWIVLALGVWGLLWMIGFGASLTVHPHVVEEAGIRVRLGPGVDFRVPWDEVEAVRKRYRSLPSRPSVQVDQDGDRRVLHLVVTSQTSVDIRLRRPVTIDLPRGHSETVDELRIYTDDPDGLVRGARIVPTAV